MGFFDRGRIQEHDVACSQCGTQFKVNFVPRAGRTMYCNECEKRIRERDSKAVEFQEEITRIEKRNKRILKDIAAIEKDGARHGMGAKETQELAKLRAELAENEGKISKLREELQRVTRLF